jgi:hypothetical protein
MHDIKDISISDMNGKKIAAQYQYESDAIVVDINQAIPGIYMVQIKSSGTIYVGKMVIQ